MTYRFRFTQAEPRDLPRDSFVPISFITPLGSLQDVIAAVVSIKIQTCLYIFNTQFESLWDLVAWSIQLNSLDALISTGYGGLGSNRSSTLQVYTLVRRSTRRSSLYHHSYDVPPGHKQHRRFSFRRDSKNRRHHFCMSFNVQETDQRSCTHRRGSHAPHTGLSPKWLSSCLPRWYCQYDNGRGDGNVVVRK